MDEPPEEHQPSAAARPDLRALLARAAGPGATFAETHVSVLALTAERVLKAKKAVRFEFIDLTTPQRRLENCLREVALNRRLAPDVYLGVVDLVDDTGAVVDHAVEMVRLPDERRLAHLVTSDAPAASRCVDGVAALLARFDASAATSDAIDACATRDHMAHLWSAGFRELAPFVGTVIDADDERAAEQLARRYLAGRKPLFDARIAAHRARDGHGDLLCDDIFCLGDGPRVLDCLEFDDHLRFGDVLADVAFLAMDLEALGHPELAQRFVRAYRAASGDVWPASLEHFYVAYRAQVRAKVACLRAGQGDGPSAARAQLLLRLARTHLERGRPRLVLVGGLPGTGKSTIAVQLAARLGATLVRSDEVRKELAGIPPETRATAAFREDLYDPAHTAATYDAMRDRARDALEHGLPVVLDASWSDTGERAAAATIAAQTASDIVALCCTAPEEVTADRMRARAAAGTDASDADAAIARAMAAHFDAWPAAVVLHTDRPLDVVVDDAAAAVV